MINKIISEIKKHKHGIVAGLIVGAAAAFYVSSQPMSIMFAVEQPGLIDSMLSEYSVSQLAFAKMLITYMGFGALIGYAFSIFYPKRK